MQPQTLKCVICYGEPHYFGGHVHDGDKIIIAGTCKEHFKHQDVYGRVNCKGCYGEWTEQMECTPEPEPSNYGIDKSELLQKIKEAGLKPIGITVMVCEETFIFETEDEAEKGWDIFKNEGWWYGREKFITAWKNYVEKSYDGKEIDAPKVYWL